MIVVLVTFVVTDFSLQVRYQDLAKQIGSWIAFTLPGAPDINNYPQTNLIVAGATWTLCLEWAFYFTLPVFGILVSKNHKKMLLPAVVGLPASFFIFTLAFIPYSGIAISFLGGALAVFWIENE